MPPSLVEQLCAIGLPMTTLYATGQQRISWTTDEATASKASELGAIVTDYQSSDPKFSGWEVRAV